MNEKDRDLMERYIYQVVRRLSKAQREDIAMELRELIGDMAEELGMGQALEKLGNPAVLAKEYRDEKNYVIGPEYYDNYVWVLKIVLICVLASAVFSVFVTCLTEGNWNTLAEDMTRNTLISLIASFGLVTLIFAALERQHVKVEIKEMAEWSVGKLDEGFSAGKKTWKPEQLSPLPDKKALISRSDSVVTIVIIVVLGGIFLLAPHLFGAYIFEKGEFVRTIPMFNMEQWNRILPFLITSLLFGFVDEMIRLVTGRYCRVVLVSNVICSALQLVCIVIALKLLPFWNANFMEEVNRASGRKAGFRGDFLNYYGTDLFSNLILAFIGIVTVCEVGHTIYKTLRYDKKEYEKEH